MRYATSVRRDAARASAEPVEAARSSEDFLSVEITTPRRFATIGRAWQELGRRAIVANAFMEPALIAAAAATDCAEIHVLLVWGPPQEGAGSPLLGGWVLARRRASRILPFGVLKTPIHGHTFLGSPVLDRTAAAPALSAMLDAIASEPDLPKILNVESLDAAGPIAAVFAEVLAEKGLASAVIETRQRPMLAKADPGCTSHPVASSRHKALRRRRNRLAALGELTFTQHEDAEEVDTAFEEFLVLEAAGWKGRRSRRGQAILRNPDAACFFRRAVASLAARRLVRITALRLDGRAIALQVMLVCGDTVFGWKTTYDEAFRAGAPGLLLHEDLTERLLGDGNILSADSCSHDDSGPMGEFWTGRRSVCDVIIDVRPRRTAQLALLQTVSAGHLHLLKSARRLRASVATIRHRYLPRPAPPAGVQR